MLLCPNKLFKVSNKKSLRTKQEIGLSFRLVIGQGVVYVLCICTLGFVV